MTPFKSLVIPEQYANALRHIAFLKSLPDDKFDMYYYTQAGDGQEFLEDPDCDTVACSAGWLTRSLKLRPKDWIDSHKCMEAIDYPSIARYKLGLDVNEHKECWQYLFSADWRRVDNSPYGAALRMQRLYEVGLDDNWQEQMCGETTLEYEQSELKLLENIKTDNHETETNGHQCQEDRVVLKEVDTSRVRVYTTDDELCGSFT